MKRLAFAVAVLLLGFAGLASYAVASGRIYRGAAQEPPAWSANTPRQRVVAEARKLIGIWYDPLQGYLGNVGGRSGFIVCMDVPVLAYRNAGTSIQRLLETDYAAHRASYGTHAGAPGDPFFHRRARNLYTYSRANGRLDLQGPPRPGDVVFMSRTPKAAISHIAVVSDVRSDGTYSVVEASRDYFYATREVDGADLFRRGWIFRGFGRLLDD